MKEGKDFPWGCLLALLAALLFFVAYVLAVPWLVMWCNQYSDWVWGIKR